MIHTRSEREIDKIAESCQIVADTLIMLEPYVVEGACVSDLDRMAEDFIIARGARPAFKGYMGFPATFFKFVNFNLSFLTFLDVRFDFVYLEFSLSYPHS